MAAKSLDDFLAQFGNPGRCQLLYSLLIFICMFNWTTVQQFNIVMSYVPPHHCKLPNKNWTIEEFIPPKSNCTMYADPANHSLGTTPCLYGMEYHTERGEIYPSNDYDLVCEREYLFRMALSLPYVGVMLGGILLGFASDKFGRKWIITLMMPVFTAFVIANSYSWDIASFITIRFFLGIVQQGVQTNCMTYMAELFRRNMRTVMSYVFAYSAAILLPVQFYMMYFLKDWRTVHLIMGLLTLVAVILTWLLPESVIWLLSNGKLKKAERILMKFAKFNKIKISPTDLAEEIQQQVGDLEKLHAKKTSSWSTFKILFTNPSLRKVILSNMYIIFANSCVLNGLSFSISSLEGNLYENYLINSGIQIVVLSLALHNFTKYGRVRILIIQFVLSGLFSASAYVILHYSDNVHSVIATMAIYLALVSRNLVQASTAMVLTYAAELIPTSVRSTGVGLTYVASRFGSAISPQILYTLNHYWPPLPHVVYSAMILLSALIIFFLPETFHTSLPRTIEDLEKIMKGKKVTEDEERKPLLKNSQVENNYETEAKKTAPSHVHFATSNEEIQSPGKISKG